MRSAMSLVATMAVLSGCATTLPKLSELSPVPPARQLKQEKSASDATLTIARDKSFAGSLVGYKILLDGHLAAEISAGEFLVLGAAPGERVVEVRHPSALVGSIGDSVTLRAEPKAKYFFRINSDVGQIRLLRTTEESLRSGQ